MSTIILANLITLYILLDVAVSVSSKRAHGIVSIVLFARNNGFVLAFKELNVLYTKLASKRLANRLRLMRELGEVRIDLENNLICLTYENNLYDEFQVCYKSALPEMKRIEN